MSITLRKIDSYGERLFILISEICVQQKIHKHKNLISMG